ncbi:hypothetical protein BHQ15_12245 [Mycolicibacillus koreensis]|nr:hypothetical protein BHQ15_12245 [Mycolicibacillus koreensis]
MTRLGYAHDAVVQVYPGGSPNALGAAITLALCGSWDHPPPCPLASHHTANNVIGEDVSLRILFAADAADEPRVRRLIGEALATEELIGPDGRVTRWRLKSAAAGRLRKSEQGHVADLIAHH